MRDSEQFALYGLEAARPTVNFAAMLSRTQQVVYQVQEKKQLIGHLEAVDVTAFSGVGNAVFEDPHRVRLADGRSLQAERFVLCVGGSAKRLGFPGSEYALTHSDVWTLDRLPASVIVVGGGATGCQLASIFAAFGSQVTLMDVAPRLLAAEDDLVASAIMTLFQQRGMRIITAIEGLTRIDLIDGQRRLSYTQHGQSHHLFAEAVVLAVGWPGNLSALNLAAAGVETSGSYIQVNDYLQTSAAHIFAAGDITGKMMLVQSASYQARIAVENALLGTDRADAPRAEHRLVPHGGFTDPEYGSVGLTEAQARQSGDVATAVVPYADLDRGVIDGHTEGFCKLIVDRTTRRILGAHVVGEQAVEIVLLVSAGMGGGLGVEQLANLELAYPTFAAIVGLAARQIVRELGIVPVAPEWRALKQLRGAEWERREPTS
jgi:dihydrolipoamide dehydrogenase